MMTMARGIRRGLVALGTLIVAGVLYALARPSPLAVETATVSRGALEQTVEDQGETRVRERYVIAAPVAGRLDRIVLREGDTVRPGMTVARLEPAPLDARAFEAGAARVRQADDAVSAAQAQAEQARTALDQAVRTRDRLLDLSHRNLVSSEERERAETEAASRARDAESARFRAQAAGHEADAARAALLAGRAHELLIRAPAFGRVLRIPERSERVVAAGATLLEIGDAAKVEVVVDLLSADAVAVRPGQRVRVEGWGGPPLPGQVRSIEPSGFTRVSALGVEEQRVNVIADLDQVPAALGDRFRVDVRVIVWSSSSALRVPLPALFRDGERWAVFVVDAGRARRRPVTIGHQGADAAEVLSGLTEGNVVLLYPGDRITDGTRVRAR